MVNSLRMNGNAVLRQLADLIFGTSRCAARGHVGADDLTRRLERIWLWLLRPSGIKN